MVIVVSYPFRRPPCCVKRNVRYGSQGTHRDMVSVDIGTPDVYIVREKGFTSQCTLHNLFTWTPIYQQRLSEHESKRKSAAISVQN